MSHALNVLNAARIDALDTAESARIAAKRNRAEATDHDDRATQATAEADALAKSISALGGEVSEWKPIWERGPQLRPVDAQGRVKTGPTPPAN